MGRAAAYSFYPGKNWGAWGEAGAVTTDDERLARRCQMLRDHGQSKKYFHDYEGYNGRLDAIQAGILRVKLKYLLDWNHKRRQNAHHYDELFDSLSNAVSVPCESARARSVYHLYVIRVPNRDQLQADLARADIGTQVHYPIPLHFQKAYRNLWYKKGDF